MEDDEDEDFDSKSQTRWRTRFNTSRDTNSHRESFTGLSKRARPHSGHDALGCDQDPVRLDKGRKLLRKKLNSTEVSFSGKAPTDNLVKEPADFTCSVASDSDFPPDSFLQGLPPSECLDFTGSHKLTGVSEAKDCYSLLCQESHAAEQDTVCPRGMLTELPTLASEVVHSPMTSLSGEADTTAAQLCSQSGHHQYSHIQSTVQYCANEGARWSPPSYALPNGDTAVSLTCASTSPRLSPNYTDMEKETSHFLARPPSCPQLGPKGKSPGKKRQTSLLSFLTSQRATAEQVQESCPVSQTHSRSSAADPHSLPSCEVGLGRSELSAFHTRAQHQFPSASGTGPVVSISKGASRGKYPCPFYKKVPGTGFVVDAFKHGSIPGCSGYFLSHFHADHYQGLTKSFAHTIYCTQVTANLVKLKLRVGEQHLRPLPVDQTVLIGSVEVTLLDANHCPGAVLFLFRLTTGENYLHSGDFRYCQSMRDYPQLAGLTIHNLFLDTTYCNPRYDFPLQSDVIEFAVDKSLCALSNDPTSVIVCGSYTIGKEKVFLAIAEALDCRVLVSTEKKAVLDSLDSEQISQRLTTDGQAHVPVHVLPMGKLNLEGLWAHLQSCGGRYSSLLAFKPTGWTHSPKRVSLSEIKPQTKGAVTIYGIPYSEHSSFYELQQFVQFLRPLRVTPTVGNGSPKAREEMQAHFGRWLAGPAHVTVTAEQTTLTAAFQKR